MDRGAAENPGQLTLFDERAPAQPAARRTLVLAGRCVEAGFERRARRTIALRVDADGLTIVAPRRAPWRDIAAFAQSKARWIVGRLDAWAALGRRAPPLALRSGERLPWRGGALILDVRCGAPAIALAGSRLAIRVPEPQRREAVRGALLPWMRGQAFALLAPRVAQFAARLGMPSPALAVSNARTQWGVCTAGGRIRLAWRLVHLAPELADYVVAHEVAHLRELNHSKRFWGIVGTLYPEWRAARERLKRIGATLPEL